ncbi:MAG: Uma2 family endonuclease [Myxococcales bacterium]
MSEDSKGDRWETSAEVSEWETPVGVAESMEQGEIIAVLRSSLERLARQRGWEHVYVGANNYFAWAPERPREWVAPDVYVASAPPKPRPKIWKTWLPGHSPPHWALEIVSVDWKKDYDQDPAKYEELGTRELVLFDPDAAKGRTHTARRFPLTIYRRTAEGRLAVSYQGPGPAFSEELGIWLFPTSNDYQPLLRLSEDEAGTKIVLTTAEAEEAEHAGRVAERAAREAERAAWEAERAEKVAAQEALAKAKAELDKLKRELRKRKKRKR